MYRKHFTLAFALVLALMAAGCAPAAAPTSAPSPVSTATTVSATPTPSILTIADAAGRQVTINAIPQRIISVAPSDTEILFALGLSPKVVAVDDFSDYPPEAKALPKIGGTSDKYNFEQIVALKPDVVFAAGITSPDAIKKLEDLKLTVVVLGTANTTLDSILTDITLAGQITGTMAQAKELTDSMKQRVDAVKAKVAPAKTKPRVYWELDATDPTKPYTVGPGSFVDGIITLAGGVNIFADANSPYPQVSAEQVVAANPEVIILPDAAYGISVDSVLARPGWQDVDAVKNKHVYPIDDSIVSRPGPRVVDGIEATAKLIHPELFQ
jgi:cobalamin transport system substrate-binding protein